MREEQCNPRWKEVLAADERLVLAKQEYLASAEAAGDAVDNLLRSTDECARRMRNGLHALEGGRWPW